MFRWHVSYRNSGASHLPIISGSKRQWGGRKRVRSIERHNHENTLGRASYRDSCWTYLLIWMMGLHWEQKGLLVSVILRETGGGGHTLLTKPHPIRNTCRECRMDIRNPNPKLERWHDYSNCWSNATQTENFQCTQTEKDFERCLLVLCKFFNKAQ